TEWGVVCTIALLCPVGYLTRGVVSPTRRPESLAGRCSRCQRLDCGRRHALAANSPIAALDLLDRDHRHLAHVLTLDTNHRLGESLDHLLLLGVRKDSFDHLYLDKWHVSPPVSAHPG